MPEGMTDIEWLAALAETEALKARWDETVDLQDWRAYEALHAPDHGSHNDGFEPRTGRPK